MKSGVTRLMINSSGKRNFEVNAEFLKKQIVDDDPSLRRVMSEGLADFLGGEYEISVDTAVDGLDGWDKLESGCFDILITDFQMPNMNGLQLIRKVRKENRSIGIVMLSGTSEALPSAIDAGADYVFGKPASIFLLAEAIEGVIEKKEPKTRF